MAVALIQGASRGLGFQFAKVLASRPNIAQVIATSRSAEKSDALLDLQKQYPDKVHLVGLDVTSEETIKTSVPILTHITSGKLDLIINCSAILHPSGRGETSLRDVSLEVPKPFGGPFTIH
jgi:NAD(P)-dependent dehydrogenase (short-subunit alcohol dehydrogenase family)